MILIDKEKSMIELNKEKIKDQKNIKILQTDILEYVPKIKFDLIIAY
jgi:hypothetical protein